MLLAGTGVPAAVAYEEHAPSPASTEPKQSAGTGSARAAAPGAAATPGELVSYLKSITGSRTVTGQHNKEPLSQPTQYTEQAHGITGVYPGLWGGEFGFGASDLDDRQTMVDEAKNQWNSGSLAALTWHVCPPTRGSSCGWEAGTGIMDELSADQWTELTTDGTELNSAWKRRLDEIVPYLQQLEDAGVPALFRPLHEMNGDWFWWGAHGGDHGTRALYQLTHDYLTREKGLDHLVWVWNVDAKGAAGQMPDYYPGDAYVDVVSVDAWNDAGFPSGEQYATLQDLAAGKPLALAEVGRIPSPSDLAAQPEWTYFMVWSEMLTDPVWNTPERIRETYAHERSLNQGELGVGGAAPR
ncbi:glycosyl hydrolase [Streptomyces daliensis]|uniref:Glycosyl hydrolase n=1 Tax=Streptomyces daliensis TaxID=299421 RepID=A0A8T4IIW5_9ACTN|nr:glycosyl hydrolase [Streptomyces daliensis]